MTGVEEAVGDMARMPALLESEQCEQVAATE
jgi:hypothetical protein